MFGFLEPAVFLLAQILVELLERMQHVDSQRFRPSFSCPESHWPGRSAALFTLQQRLDSGYMQLVRVDVAMLAKINEPGVLYSRPDPLQRRKRRQLHAPHSQR
jgi:hypothetical protein